MRPAPRKASLARNPGGVQQRRDGIRRQEFRISRRVVGGRIGAQYGDAIGRADFNAKKLGAGQDHALVFQPSDFENLRGPDVVTVAAVQSLDDPGAVWWVDGLRFNHFGEPQRFEYRCNI